MLKKIAAAYFSLGALSAAAVTIGAFSHIFPEASGLRSWVTPLCILTAVSSLVIARLTTRLSRMPGCR